jgi:hypothetical protein
MYERTDEVEVVAHDLNNLLTTIVGSADLLTASLPEGQDREDAAQIGLAGRAAAVLVRHLPQHAYAGGHGNDDEEIFEP